MPKQPCSFRVFAAMILVFICGSCAPSPTEIPAPATPGRTEPVVEEPSATQTTPPATVTLTTTPTVSDPPGTEAPTPYPPALASTRTARVTTGTPLPYPPPRTPIEHRPTDTEVPFYTPTATSVESIFLPPPIETGVVAMLYEGDVWLVRPSRPPQRLTRSGDIRRLFGWNHSGELLLMSRQKEVASAEGVENVYSLWVYDIVRGIEYKRSGDMAYFIAGWSPAGDQIAVYTGETRITKIIDLNDNLLHELYYTLGNFAWSPDGSKLAIATFTDAHLNRDGQAYNNLSVWDLSTGQVTPYNDASNEVQHQPVWSIDSTKLVFQRSSGNDDVSWELWDIRSGERATLFQPGTFSLDVSRSPCSDQMIYRSRLELMRVDFRVKPRRIAEGETFFWLPDCSGAMVLSEGGAFEKINLGDPGDQFVTYGGNPIWISNTPQYFIAR